jgi:profilin
LQAYIDDSLMQPLGGGGTLTHAAICGHDGGIWAQSPDFPGISDDEVAAIMTGFDDSTALATNGLRLGGEKYMMIAGEPGEVLRGKKGPNGVTVKKTNSALVIGIYGEGVTPGECNLVGGARSALCGMWYERMMWFVVIRSDAKGF